MDILKLDRILPRAKYWLTFAFLFNLILAPAALAYQLVASPSPTRTGATPLDGTNISGNIYVFVDSNAGIKSARFFIDGTLIRTEGAAPWDLAGTEANNNSKPFDTRQLSDGSHQITAALTLSNNTSQTLSAAVNVQNQVLLLSATPGNITAAIFSKTTTKRTLSLQTSNSAPQTITLTANQPWLSFSNASGPAPFTTDVILDARQLSGGTYSDVITVSAASYPSIKVPVSFTLAPVSTNYTLMFSTAANRSNPIALAGQQTIDPIYIFLWPETNVKQVRFFIDSPGFSGIPVHTETAAPFDFVGGTSSAALPFTTASLSNGTHALGAEITLKDNSIVYTTSDITVGQPDGFIASPQTVAFTLTQPQTQAQQTLNVSYGNNAARLYTTLSDQSWLSVTPLLGSTPASHTVTVNTSQLQPGHYSGSITVLGETNLVIPVTLAYTGISSNFNLQVSQQANRSSSVALAGSQQKGNVYIHVQPQTGVASVAFFMDRQPLGNPDRLETSAPFDLAGTAANGTAQAYNTVSLGDGNHLLYARVTRTNNQSETVLASFQINNSQQSFVFSPTSVSASLPTTAAPVDIAVALGLEVQTTMTPDFALTSNVPWASVTPGSGLAPANLTVTFNPTVMQPGNYQGLITATSNQLGNKSLVVNLTVIDSQPHLLGNPDTLSITHAPNSGVHNSSLEIATNDNRQIAFSATSDCPWLSLASATGTTPQPLGFALDTQDLSAGLHQGHILLHAELSRFIRANQSHH